MAEEFNQDPCKQVVDSAIAEKFDDLPVVIKDFVVVAEVLTDEGISLLVSHGPSTTPWTVSDYCSMPISFLMINFITRTLPPMRPMNDVNFSMRRTAREGLGFSKLSLRERHACWYL